MLKILIVDDEQVVRVYLQSIVNWEQYDCQVVTTCENGMEALEVMAQQPIDLILTDLEMPRLLCEKQCKRSRHYLNDSARFRRSEKAIITKGCT